MAARATGLSLGPRTRPLSVLEPLCGGAAKTVRVATMAVPRKVARISTKARRRFMVFDSGRTSCPSFSYFSLENSRFSRGERCEIVPWRKPVTKDRWEWETIRSDPAPDRDAERLTGGSAGRGKIISVLSNCAGTSHAFATDHENGRH